MNETASGDRALLELVALAARAEKAEAELRDLKKRLLPCHIETQHPIEQLSLGGKDLEAHLLRAAGAKIGQHIVCDIPKGVHIETEEVGGDLYTKSRRTRYRVTILLEE